MRSRMGVAISQKLWRRDVFLGYSRPLWMRSSAHVGRGEEVPAGTVANCMLTHLPADSMSGGVSLCVRFMTSAAATTSTTTKAPTEAEDFTTMPSESTEGSSTGPTASSGSTSLSGGGSDSSSEPGEDSGSGGFGCNGNSSTDPSRPLQPSPELQPQKQAQLAPQQQPLEAPQKPAPSKSPASSPPEENLPPKLPDDGLKGDEGEDPGEAGEEGVQGELTHGGASQDETDALEKQEELHPVPADNARNEPSSSIVGSPKPTQHLTSTPKLLNRETAPPPPLRKNISLLNRWMRQQCKPNLSKILAKTMLVKMPRFLRRLSDVETSTVKHLTIVVHSAAWVFSHTTLSLSVAVLSVAVTLVQHLILGRNVGSLGTFSWDAQLLVQTLSHPVGRIQRQFVYSSRIRCDPLRPVSKILRRNTRSTCVTWSRRTHYMYQPSTFLGDSANKLPAD
uniref:Putative toxoplasma gondii family A protein n=1 Tax=Toxoplasma gondii COUG TaxID=1074873 RepID=A0A2G8Y5Z5_TOXGO|nr:putative toxoplasma gondii family A protein [Toxoplasma gondii COUG]